MKPKLKKRLGDLLVEEQLISEAQLDNYLFLMLYAITLN